MFCFPNGINLLAIVCLALSPIPICLYATRKKRRPEVNQGLVIIGLSLVLGMVWHILLPLLMLALHFLASIAHL
ncbi:hypothetical protein STRDD10_00753 [Streptococcus sp. DD10]|nr:hypothetical protein STRDD10_00753 [Streptococcus sp. DD10]